MLNNLATDALKTAKIQKAAEAVVIYLEIILRIKLQKSQKLHERVIQNHMKKKYLEKDIYISRTKTEDYWWSKINIIIIITTITIYNNGTSKNNKIITQYKKWPSKFTTKNWV